MSVGTDSGAEVTIGPDPVVMGATGAAGVPPEAMIELMDDASATGQIV